MKRAAWVAMGMTFAFGASAGDDPKRFSLLPWNGAVVGLADNDLRFEGSMTQRMGPLDLQLQLSAPLDKETRLAQFGSNEGPAAGVSATVTLEVVSTYFDVNPTGAMVPIRQRACEDLAKKASCTNEDLCLALGLDKCSDERIELVVLPALCEKHKLFGKECNSSGLRLPGSTTEAAAASAPPRFASVDRILNKVSAHEARAQEVASMLGFAPAPTPAQRAFLAEPPTKKLRWKAGLELSGNYDELSAYSAADAAAAASTVKDWSAAAGAIFRARPVEDLGFEANLRVGGKVASSPDTFTARRCTDVPSTDTSVSGQVCDDAAVFLSEEPTTSAAGYARLGFTYVMLSSLIPDVGLPDESGKGLEVYPGAEAAMNFEQLGASGPYLEFRLTAFLVPAGKDALLRSGVGFSFVTPLSGTAEQTFSPYGFIAANF